jgi:hypothetical protein
MTKLEQLGVDLEMACHNLKTAESICVAATEAYYKELRKQRKEQND